MSTIIDRIAVQTATLGPIGHLPKAPGTWGSLAASVAAPWLFLPLPLTGRLITLAVILAVGTWASSRAEKVLAAKDPGCVIIDELLGQWFTFLPFFAFPIWVLPLGFVLFRVFDILKPWPVKLAEDSFPGGFGVMIDDLVAGGYAIILITLILLLI